MTTVNNTGKSVLGELSKGDSAHDEAMDSIATDLAFDASGGSMGAVISPTPELGQSAYQMPTVPDGKKPVRG